MTERDKSVVETLDDVELTQIAILGTLREMRDVLKDILAELRKAK